MSSLIHPTARSFVGAIVGLDNGSESPIGRAVRDFHDTFIYEIFGVKSFSVSIGMKLDANPMALVFQSTLPNNCDVCTVGST